jgi:hypothetical protein
VSCQPGTCHNPCSTSEAFHRLTSRLVFDQLHQQRRFLGARRLSIGGISRISRVSSLFFEKPFRSSSVNAFAPSLLSLPGRRTAVSGLHIPIPVALCRLMNCACFLVSFRPSISQSLLGSIGVPSISCAWLCIGFCIKLLVPLSSLEFPL